MEQKNYNIYNPLVVPVAEARPSLTIPALVPNFVLDIKDDVFACVRHHRF